MATSKVRTIVAALIVLVAAAVIVPPMINVGRYRTRIAESLSRAVGRPVTIGNLELRVIPQPGFYMENVVIADDPAVSAEPILRAEELTAYLRLSSLWRGRLEIAKLNMRYPSLNVVRGADGHWNVESLLWRAARTKAAPTSQNRPEVRARFPYIDVTGGRVNFKIGQEKSVFSFSDADLALWSPREDEWRVRIEAHPVRTDTNISDTGTMRADIAFHRAEMLRDTPLHGKVVWERGQLGMLTKLMDGRDRGWRGTVDMSADVSGTPSELHFASATKVQDFRRYDVYSGDALTISGSCEGIGNLSDETVTGFHCKLPAGDGTVHVSGNIDRPHAYSVSVAAENVGFDSIVELARHAKKDIPNDATASGKLNASATIRRVGDAPAVWAGDGTTTPIVLKGSVLRNEIKLAPLKITIGNAAPAAATTRTAKAKRSAPVAAPVAGAIEHELLAIAPFEVPLGAKEPALARIAVSAREYAISVSGPAHMQDVIGLARFAGLAVPKVALTGDVTASLTVGGELEGLPQPHVRGTATLQNGSAEVPGISQPVKFARADIAFGDDAMRFTGIQASAGTLAFTGAASFPRSCDVDSPCAGTMELQFDDLDVAQLNALVNPRLKQRPWYRLFGSSSEESLLLKADVSGRISAKRLAAAKLTANRFFADFRLNKGELLVSNMNAAIFGGTHEGQWKAKFTGDTPQFTGTGRLNGVALAKLSSLARDPIGTGTLNSTYDFKFSGASAEQIAKSLDGHATFDLTNATLRPFAVSNHGPARITRFQGELRFTDGVLTFDQSEMATPAGVYSVRGKAGLDYNLELQLKPEHGPGYAVSGTLHEPEVTAIPAPNAAEASLK